MPTKSEVLDWMVKMQEDLIGTNQQENLIRKFDTKTAWGKLTDDIKQKKKELFQSGFTDFENLVHRDFRLPPRRLVEERLQYAQGKEPTPVSGQKKYTAKKTETQKPKSPEKEKISRSQVSNSVSSSGVNKAPARPNPLHQKKEDLERDEILKLHEQVDEMERRLKETQAELHQAEVEKEYWVDRLSQVTGEKLTRNNPDVADLSDPKRPQKLGDLYSELYDNEWTDAMEMLTKAEDSERRGINILVDILQRSHETCIKLADDQLQTLQRDVILDPSKAETRDINCPIEVQRSLKDAQKQASLHSLPAVQQNVRRQLSSLKEKFGDFPLDKLVPFINKCTEICWGMVMQSPRMEFLFPTGGRGERLDKDKFKEFTRSGDRLDFVVWPALAVHKQGSLVVRGVAQALVK